MMLYDALQINFALGVVFETKSTDRSTEPTIGVNIKEINEESVEFTALMNIILDES